jgi:hypothetical protein
VSRFCRDDPVTAAAQIRGNNGNARRAFGLTESRSPVLPAEHGRRAASAT